MYLKGLGWFYCGFFCGLIVIRGVFKVAFYFLLQKCNLSSIHLTYFDTLGHHIRPVLVLFTGTSAEIVRDLY
jgi:hypothetical protein